MDPILNSLVPPSAAPADSAAPAEGAQLTPPDAAPATDPAAVVQAFPFLGALSSGKVKGVVFPTDWKNPATKVVTPDVVQNLGLVFYKPTNPKNNLVLGIFNPKKTTPEEVAKLDKEGKLGGKFPSISNFVPSTAGQDTGDASAPGPAGVAPVDAAPPGPSTSPIPVQTGPPAPAGVQDRAAQARLQSLGTSLPSQHAVPGGGAILNSLIKRAV